MRLFTSIIALATFMVAGAASAALTVSSAQSGGLSVLPGDTVTIDISISTSGNEAQALGLRAAKEVRGDALPELLFEAVLHLTGGCGSLLQRQGRIVGLK